MESVDKAQSILDWAQRTDSIFMVMFVAVMFILLFVLYTAFRLLVKEREEAKVDRNNFMTTINDQQKLLSSQQQLISGQQDLLNEEKKIMQEMSGNVTTIKNNVDFLIRLNNIKGGEQ